MKLDVSGDPVVLVLDRDRERATESATAFTGPNQLVLTGGDAVVGALIGKRMGLTSLVTEAQISGRFSFDGLEAVADVRRASASCRIVVTGEHLPEGIADEAVRRGASDIVHRPFGSSEFRSRLGLSAKTDDGLILHIPTVDDSLRAIPFSRRSSRSSILPMPIIADSDSNRWLDSGRRHSPSAIPASCSTTPGFAARLPPSISPAFARR